MVRKRNLPRSGKLLIERSKSLFLLSKNRESDKLIALILNLGTWKCGDASLLK
jgi:hypothetical protein